MRNVPLYVVDAFTTEPFAGNPAGVVLDADGLTDDEMLRIAREVHHSETAFVMRADGDDHDLRVRFFTPTVEVPSCGHATIAAHHARGLLGALGSHRVRQRSPGGLFEITVEEAGGAYRVAMTQGPIEFGFPFVAARRADVCRALGVAAEDLEPGLPVQVVSTGHSKVMVPMRNRDRLRDLRPDFDALARLSDRVDCNGWFPFVLTPELATLTEGRMFGPAMGIREDPVTGNANGPLGAYLVRHGLVDAPAGSFEFAAAQGHSVGRPGTMTVRVDVANDGAPERVTVVGDAVLAIEGSVRLR